MDLTISLAAVTIIGTLAGIVGYFLMRARYLRELAIGKKREAELSAKVYEIAVLKEIADRIGYSLDAAKIIEIISGSLGQLLPYSTVSYMILAGGDRISFVCSVAESVSPTFIKDVRGKMLAALSEMLMEVKLDADVDESVSGAILDEQDSSPVASFFNLPISISGKLAGIINVASKTAGLYVGDDTVVLYRIAIGASEAVSKLQEVLEQEKGKLAAAVESLSDGVLMVDRAYQLIVANRRLRQLLATIESPKIFDIASALAGTFDLRTKMEEVMSGAQSAPFEIVLHDKVLAVSAARVSGQRGQKPIGLVVLFHDITDAKALEKLRQDFTAMMVHELRSPLTSIKSTIAMIKSAGVGTIGAEDLGKYLATIDSTSETMLDLVNDLLDVAKVEAGKFDIVCDRGDLGEVVLERIESFKPQMAAAGLTIEVDIERDLPAAWFDKVRIKQVMNNLLSNAIKYTDAGTLKVGATVERVNGVPIDILVAVADTGIGIEPSQAEKLFSKFGQLESGRGHAGLKSSGLGLYITKKIVEAVGGKIWVESAGAGAGSTFFFTVPLAETAKRGQVAENLLIPGSTTRAIKNFTSQKVARA